MTQVQVEYRTRCQGESRLLAQYLPFSLWRGSTAFARSSVRCCWDKVQIGLNFEHVQGFDQTCLVKHVQIARQSLVYEEFFAQGGSQDAIFSYIVCSQFCKDGPNEVGSS